VGVSERGEKKGREEREGGKREGKEGRDSMVVLIRESLHFVLKRMGKQFFCFPGWRESLRL
jgi:hypothetical protein